VHVQSALEIAQQGHTGDRATLPGHLELVVGYDTLTLANRGYVPTPDFPALPLASDVPSARFALEVPGSTDLPGSTRVRIEVVPRAWLPANWRENDDPWCAYLDASVLGQSAYLRPRRPGDRFCPLGLAGSTKLVSDLLIDAQVPAAWRDRVPLLVRADDSIMWVCGWRIDHRARIQHSTSQVAIVRLAAEE
jgi:tRNA(Ile)-lysidine synthase